MIKIAITGPESSGKTTIARQLADRLNGCLVNEYAREYLEKNNIIGNYKMDDLIQIAEHQYLAGKGRDCEKKHLICDTELTVIKIWAIDKFQYCPGEIISLYERQEFDIYFLCKPNIPWQPDPMREDKNRRKQLFKFYAEELFLEDVNFVILEGSEEKRLKTALKHIKSIENTI